MEILTVHESKFLLIISILCSVLFGLCWFFSAKAGLTNHDIETLIICSLVFGGFTVLGIFLLINFFRRKLILYADHLSYTPGLGKTKTFSYHAIDLIILKMERCILYDSSRKKLASFEINMPGSPDALYYLAQKGITIENKNLSTPFLSDAKSRSDSYNSYIEGYISNRWSPERIAKEKKITRILAFVLVIFCAVSLFLPLKWLLSVQVLILLSLYFIYLFLYPKITVENVKKDDYTRIPLPFWSLAPSFLVIFAFITNVNIKEGAWLSHSIIMMLLLLIPYFLVLAVRKIKMRLSNFLAMAFFIFILAFVFSPAINYAATFDKPIHETVTVLAKKENHSSRSGTKRYFYFIWQGKEQSMLVSESLYDSASEGDTVRLCINKSIFGMEYYKLHE